MATPGWYPDPGGSGGFRYWDGSAWSGEVRSSPQPGGPGPGGPASPNGPKRRTGLAVGVVLMALVLIAAVGGVVALLHPWRHPDDITDNPPTVTVSAGDDSSQTPPPPSSATPRPTHSPTPNPTSTPPPSPTKGATLDQGGGGAAACPEDDPSARADHPADGRIHGGHLSIATNPDFHPDDDNIYGFTWMTDIGMQSYDVAEPRNGAQGWFNETGVAALRISLGFDKPEQSALAMADCYASSDFYGGITSRTQNWSKAYSVGGRTGWWVRTTVRVDDQPGIEGDVVDIIVVDTGDPDFLSVYFASATIDDQRMQDADNTAIQSLQVD